ncbi:MAG TPA: DHA2 family efflux MFS transporter permease subunit [Anaerolineales bacterium]|nr:DHA2 family efflux MFS transporter permease subunit [Anaerolineales bacterium]
MNVESVADNQPRGLEGKWKILISVMFGIFMIILDSTVVNVAFTTLRREFGATLADAQWVLSIYVLSLGVTTPVSGYLADRFGIKRVYLFGLAVFVIGSFLCGLAPSLGWLIAARALQGFGGGISQPLGPAQLYRAFPPKEQGTALGYFGIVLVFAPALGPILGGWLVDANLWRLIFFINIPIGILGVILGSRFLLDYQVERKPAFDPLGLITAVIGFGSVLYAASIAESNGWTGSTTLLALGIGIVALIVHVLIELRVKEPMTSLRLFGNPIFLNAALVGYVATIAMFGAEFLMPVYLQAFRGRTALETGYILLAIAIPSGIATPLAGRLYDKIGPRMNLIVGFAVLCINTWQLSLIGATTPISYILFLLALRGLAFGLTLQTSFVAALSSVPLNVLPRGSSLLNSTRFVVQAVSVAALATVLSSAVSPDIRAQQDQAQEAQTTSTARFGICETPGVRAEENLPPGADASLASLSASAAATVKTKILSTLKLACAQSISGFESAYRITFFAAIGALILGALLPGWPRKWGGRGSPVAMPAAD